MLKSVLGRKIGMTQIFNEKGTVIPVTVVDIANALVTQIKTKEKDGYLSIQLGLLKKKYVGKDLPAGWQSCKKNYFGSFREVPVEQDCVESFSVGQPIKLDQVALEENCYVDVVGKSRGLGFQGVVKRWGFAGGPSAHGSNFHRKPGSIGNMCSQGKVVKGKKMPGQYGNKRRTVQRLKVVSVDKDGGYLFIKGSVPGKKNSLVIVNKQGI